VLRFFELLDICVLALRRRRSGRSGLPLLNVYWMDGEDTSERRSCSALTDELVIARMEKVVPKWGSL
jgi:hypothetical protein